MPTSATTMIRFSTLLTLMRRHLKRPTESSSALTLAPATCSTAVIAHITPNFIITTDDNKLQLTVVNDIPELQISESYEIEYQRIAKRKGKNIKESDEDVTIKRQYENASNFIMLLKMRQEKLYKIMRAIMLRQQEFFITGDTHALKPLVLKDIAEETGYDTSTISRAQQNKYVDTNWGIFPVK